MAKRDAALFYRSIDGGWMPQVSALFISDNVLTHFG